jgi:hypothetical protein
MTTLCIAFYESYLSTAYTVSKNLTSSLGQNVNLASEMASHTHLCKYVSTLENHTDLGRKKTLIFKVCTTPHIWVWTLYFLKSNKYTYDRSNDLFKLKEFLKSFILLEVRGGESNKGILVHTVPYLLTCGQNTWSRLSQLYRLIKRPQRVSVGSLIPKKTTSGQLSHTS